MRNASGYHRDEERWPLVPFAAPRGARELLWHIGVILAVVVPLVPPVGFLVLGEVIAMTWLLELRPIELVRVAGAYVVTGLVTAAIFARPTVFFTTAVHTFTWSRAAHVGMPLAVVLGYCIELSVSMLAVATFMAFDRRRVNRATVDLRVWQRQQARRRQLLRQWHRSSDLPEVSR
jgi:uncharacterized protein YqgC (DUF456 family)